MWLAILPYAVQIIAWLLGRYADNKETIRKFQEFVQSAKDDGLIAVQAKDEFKRQEEELKRPPDQTTAY